MYIIYWNASNKFWHHARSASNWQEFFNLACGVIKPNECVWMVPGTVDATL